MEAIILKPQEINYNVVNPVYVEKKLTKVKDGLLKGSQVHKVKKVLTLQRVQMVTPDRHIVYVYAPDFIASALNKDDHASREEKNQLTWYKRIYNTCTNDKNELMNSFWFRFLFLFFPKKFFRFPNE